VVDHVGRGIAARVPTKENGRIPVVILIAPLFR